MKNLVGFAACFMVVFFIVSSASAIPEEELYNFRSSVTGIFYFDEFNPPALTRIVYLDSLHNASLDYYVVIRKNVNDVKPYDDFFVSFLCGDDVIPTEFHTTDYSSWVETGQVSFKKSYFQITSAAFPYGNLTSFYTYCYVVNANGLVTDNNVGYTQFNLDLVPVTTIAVRTVASYCEEAAITDAINAEEDAIAGIVGNNINFFQTFFIIFQILAVVLVVLGVPIMIFLLIRWAIWKITGVRILERRME